MQSTFHILKEQPIVRVTMTRDSVCLGDDCDAPHVKQIEVQSFLDPLIFTSEIASGYLPTVAGIGHSWVCTLNEEDIAMIGKHRNKSYVGATPFADTNTVHFCYHPANF